MTPPMHRLHPVILSIVIVLLLLGCTTLAPTPTAPDASSPLPTAAPLPTSAPPVVSPTTVIAFSAFRDGSFDLYTIRPENTQLTRLTASPDSNETQPIWSPDGLRLAYLSDADGVANLYMRDLEGRDVRQLTRRRTAVVAAGWSPDNTRLAFLALPEDASTETDQSDAPLALYTVELATGNITLVRRDMQNTLDLAWSPNGERIAFTRFDNGVQNIYVTRLDGTSPLINLTNTSFNDSQAAWSPNSERIAFVSDEAGDLDIYVMAADGTGRTRLTDNPTQDTAPTWSPDGTQIAFVSDRNGSPQLFRMGDNGADQQLLAGTLSNVTSPAWQPLPRPPVVNRIAFAAGAVRGFSNLFVINTTGTGRVTLINTPEFDTITPAWSPDGTRIAFAGRNAINYDIFVMPASGGDPIRLTNGEGSNMHPAWSPDGTRIGFESNRDGVWDVYTINPQGGDLTNVTNSPSNDGNIAWSPDGTQIAFVSDRDGNLNIYTMNIDGSNLRQLTRNAGNNVFPAWSPDGRELVFRSTRTGNRQIYRMSVNGTGLRRLTNHPGDDDHPVWSPDGHQIAFVSNRPRDATNTGTTQRVFDLYVMTSDGTNVQRITSSDLNERYPAWQPQAR